MTFIYPQSSSERPENAHLFTAFRQLIRTHRVVQYAINNNNNNDDETRIRRRRKTKQQRRVGVRQKDLPTCDDYYYSVASRPETVTGWRLWSCTFVRGYAGGRRDSDILFAVGCRTRDARYSQSTTLPGIRSSERRIVPFGSIRENRRRAFAEGTSDDSRARARETNVNKKGTVLGPTAHRRRCAPRPEILKRRR